jgi:hypothetical protein
VGSRSSRIRQSIRSAFSSIKTIIRKAYADNSNDWNVRRHYHAALQYSPDTPDLAARFFGRHQPGLGNRGLVLCPCHAAVEPAVSGSGSSGIRDHQLVFFLRGLFHGSLLSSGRQEIEQSRFVNVDEPFTIHTAAQ